MNEIKGAYQLSIHPGQINVWYESFIKRHKFLDGMFNKDELAAEKKLIPKNLTDNLHHGKISKTASKKIHKAISYLTHIVPKKRYFSPTGLNSRSFLLNFITLTLSSTQIHSDNEIKSSLLEPFLQQLRQKWHCTSYIWRAEKQKNGNIHFHIITDRFIPWNELRNVWNNIQERRGYITRYRDSMLAYHKEGFKVREDLTPEWSVKAQYKAWKEGLHSDWFNPNSTDVHKICYLIYVASYLAKYVTKQEQSEDITGRLWGCSYNLTNLEGGKGYAEGSIDEELRLLESTEKCKVYDGTYFYCIFFDPKKLYSGLYPLLVSLLLEFIQHRFVEYCPPGLFSA